MAISAPAMSGARSGSRTSRRWRTPRVESSPATRRPTWPVDPVTTSMSPAYPARVPLASEELGFVRAEDLGVVARAGRVQLAYQAVDPRRHHEHVAHRLRPGVPERVRRAPRDEYRRAGAGLHDVVADPEAERALDHVPGLVVGVVDMKPGDRPLGARDAALVSPLDHHEVAVGEPERATGERGCPGRFHAPPILCLLLGGKRLAGLEQRLQVAEDERPAAHASGRPGRALEPVVHQGELRGAAPGRLDLPGHPALVLGCQLVVVEAAPDVDEPAGRVAFEDRVVAPQARPVGRPGAPRRAHLERP